MTTNTIRTIFSDFLMAMSSAPEYALWLVVWYLCSPGTLRYGGHWAVGGSSRKRTTPQYNRRHQAIALIDRAFVCVSVSCGIVVG